jgi:polyferredoxin
LNAALADAILVAHAAFVLFVVLGLVATWIGLALGLPFARNPWFRGAHLAAIAFVVVETLFGYMCPLTIWEDALRGEVSGKGFIQRWIHAWLFWNWPAWVFNVIYVAFGALVAWTWVRFPPRRS